MKIVSFLILVCIFSNIFIYGMAQKIDKKQIKPKFRSVYDIYYDPYYESYESYYDEPYQSYESYYKPYRYEYDRSEMYQYNGKRYGSRTYGYDFKPREYKYRKSKYGYELVY